MPVLSPYIPINKEIHMPKSEFMKEILIRSKEITDKYEIEFR